MSKLPEQAATLPPHYYRDNFLRLLDTVQMQYGDVLEASEQAFVDVFRGLGFDAQCLYIRLVSRVGPWFRESRLDYTELGCLGDALNELIAAQMAVAAEALMLEDIDRLYTRQELFAAAGDSVGGKKSTLLALRTASEWNELLLHWETGRIVAPVGGETVAILQLLFFGNRYQGMTDFVLSDLGVARYFPYRLDRTRRLFPHRAALDEYLALAGRGDIYRELEEGGSAEALANFASELVLITPVYDTSQRRWDRLCNRVARQLERRGMAALALQLYRRSGAHPARERRARLLEKSGDWAAAQALCLEILAMPWCEEEADAAARIQPRVRRKLEGGKLARRRDAFATLELCLDREARAVELLAAEHLCPAWSSVHYVENSLMNALFGLAFWDAIFAPVAGAFNNAYQSVPGDMYEGAFSERRRPLIERRLKALASADPGIELPAAYRKFYGYQCRWVNWRQISESLVVAASSVIPRRHLLAIWEHMLFDPRENRRGFPDLLALGSAAGEYCLIEVKGPGDTLQDSQKRWLRRFQQIGIPAQVARVSWRNE